MLIVEREGWPLFTGGTFEKCNVKDRENLAELWESNQAVAVATVTNRQ